MSQRTGKNPRAATSKAATPPAPDQALLVAVELGGDWPHGLEEFTHVTVRRVVAQEEGEGPTAFADRLSTEIEQAISRGVALSVAAVACNERADEMAIEARRRIARALLGAMAARKAGSVYLTASCRTSGRLRHALSTLATELGDEWASAGVEVSVRFGDESRSAPRNTLEHVTAHVA